MPGRSPDVAIIGFGTIGRRRAANLHPGRLVAVVEPGPGGPPADQPSSVAWFGDAETMFGTVSPDVVIVATPHHLLAPYARLALSHGSHVLVEKPGALTADQLDGTITAAVTARRRLWVGYNQRFHPAVERLMDEVASGRYGRVLFVRSQYGHGARPGFEHEWRARRAEGGGEVIDQGVHLFHLMHALLGALPVRHALLRTAWWPIEVEDNAVVVLADEGDPGGPWAVLQLSLTEWKNRFVVDVYCSGARLTLQGLGGSYGTPRLTVCGRPPSGGVPDTEVIELPGDTSWAGEWRAFCAALAEPFDPASLEAARYASSIADRCQAIAGPVHTVTTRERP
jgi:predicted dehydrogenase